MTNLIIGGALAAIGVIGLLVFWIIAIVKAFQAKETVWGVLTIILGLLIGMIFFFVKGYTKQGILSVVFLVLYLAGFGIAITAIQSDPDLLKKIEGMQQVQPGVR